MKRILVALVVTVALLAASCSSGSNRGEEADDDAPPPTVVVPAGKVRSKIWFTNDDRLAALQREVDDLGSDDLQVELATQQLLSGLQSNEVSAGFTTQIPENVQILSLEALDAFHRIDLSANFASEASETDLAIRLAQLGCTITAYEPDQILISVDGDIPMMSDILDLSAPVTCSMLVTALGSISSARLTPIVTVPEEAEPEQGAALSVVFKEPDNPLDVRDQPGLDAAVISIIPPLAVDLLATGRSAEVDGSRWVEMLRSEDAGWVHGGFVTETQTAFADDPRPAQRLAQLVGAWNAGESGEHLIAENGLWIVHFDPQRRFPRDQIGPLLTDPTEMQWGSPNCDPDECAPMSFSAAISGPLVSAHADVDSVIGHAPAVGLGGTPAEFVIPSSFTNAPYLSVHDRGDDPEAEGLDWVTWYVYFTYLDDEPYIAGLSTDFWSP